MLCLNFDQSAGLIWIPVSIDQLSLLFWGLVIDFFHPYEILEPWMTCKIGIGMCEKRRNYALNALLKWHRVNLCSWTTWGGRQVWRFETNINSLILPLPTLIQFYIELDFVQGNHDYTDKGRTPNCDTWITHKIVIPE